MTDQTEPSEQAVTIDDLAAFIRRQRAELGELRAEVADLRRGKTSRVDVDDAGGVGGVGGVGVGVGVGGLTTRRSLLRGAGLAGAVGVVAAAGVDSGNAAAADGGPLVIGQSNESSSQTQLSPSGAAGNLSGNVFTASTFTTGGSAFPAALAGFAYGDRNIHNGVYAFTNSRTNASTSTGHAVVAYAASGTRSNVLFETNLTNEPTTDTVPHRRGEMRAQTNGDLWWCAVSGTPGTWKKIAGPAVKTNDELNADVATVNADVATVNADVATVNADVATVNAQLATVKATVDTYSVSATTTLELVTPFRVYDSRFSMAPTESGPLPIGASRTIPVRDARNVQTGAVVTPNAVPAGATGVIYTISTIAPDGAGYLSVVPKEATAVTAATINFDATSPTVLNNTSTVKLGGDREVRVIAGGGLGGNCNFLIDIVGYYRPISDVVA